MAGSKRVKMSRRRMRQTVDGRRMTDEELTSALRNWTAGHGTVAAGLSNVLCIWTEDPQFQDDLAV